jgi:hypothetical protein
LNLDKLEKFNQLKKIGIDNIIIVKSNKDEENDIIMHNKMLQYSPVVDPVTLQTDLPLYKKNRHISSQLTNMPINTEDEINDASYSKQNYQKNLTKKIMIREELVNEKPNNNLNKVFLFINNNINFSKVSKKLNVPGVALLENKKNIFFTIKFTTLKNLILETKLALYPQ